MKRFTLIFAALSLSLAFAEERTWTSSDGRTLRAELLSYNIEAERVTIKTSANKEFTLPFDKISEEDRAYLRELAEKEKAKLEELKKAAAEKAGKSVKETTDAGNSFHVYYPQSYSLEKKPSVLILFSPGGGGAGIMRNFKQGADKLGWVLVGCDNLKNGQDWDEGKVIFNDLLAAIEERVDPGRLYVGGMSGGAMRAYLYTAVIERPWKGVIACGGWLGGGKNHELKFTKKMAVAIVNGDTDKNANLYIESTKKVFERRGGKVEVIMFPGGHTVGPPDVIEKAMTFVHENTNTDED